MTSLLSPHFLLPVGTKVVLGRDLPLTPESRQGHPLRYKKAGCVGEIISAPVSNEYPYQVLFADRAVVRARRPELIIHRADSPLAEQVKREIAAYEQYLILSVRVGSHAFGLADSDSDADERGIYLPPAEWHWSLQTLPPQVEFKSIDGNIVDRHLSQDRRSQGQERDVCWWEIAKFLRLALKANPNALEVLYTSPQHVLHSDEIGQQLLGLRSAFLSRHIFKTYSGYVLSQFRKMQKLHDQGKPHRSKHAMHLIRLLYSGIWALETGEIMVDVGCHREELLRIKHDHLPFEEIHSHALDLEKRFQEAFARTTLPERPDAEAVDRFLIRARRSRANPAQPGAISC